jgi:hypothetical protein
MTDRVVDERVVALYRRLAGRRDMNYRNALGHWKGTGISRDSMSRFNSYQNAINDLCSTFGTTEGELQGML